MATIERIITANSQLANLQVMLDDVEELALGPPDVPDGNRVAGGRTQPRPHERPRSHVPRLFLRPHHFLDSSIAIDDPSDVLMLEQILSGLKKDESHITPVSAGRRLQDEFAFIYSALVLVASLHMLRPLLIYIATQPKSFKYVYSK
jgi:hypothetical protein